MGRAILLLLALALAGCATKGEGDPRDPLEPLNRRVDKFNDVVDENIGRPVATAYRKLLHAEIRTRVSNFFANLADPWIGINNFLQGKFEEGVVDWARFVFNSTFGVFGLHDIASDLELEKHDEDFGQTLGRWGAPAGPYLMLPILSSSTLRDGSALVVDYAVDPVQEVRPIAVRNSLYGLRFVNRRAELLEASRILEEAALDKYVFQRDAYLQRRRNQVYDGRPPREVER